MVSGGVWLKSVKRVSEWLTSIGLQRYSRDFYQSGVDATELARLVEDVSRLVKRGVLAIHARKIIREAKSYLARYENWRETSSEDSSLNEQFNVPDEVVDRFESIRRSSSSFSSISSESEEASDLETTAASNIPAHRDSIPSAAAAIERPETPAPTVSLTTFEGAPQTAEARGVGIDNIAIEIMANASIRNVVFNLWIKTVFKEYSVIDIVYDHYKWMNLGAKRVSISVMMDRTPNAGEIMDLQFLMEKFMADIGSKMPTDAFGSLVSAFDATAQEISIVPQKIAKKRICQLELYKANQGKMCVF